MVSSISWGVEQRCIWVLVMSFNMWHESSFVLSFTVLMIISGKARFSGAMSVSFVGRRDSSSAIWCLMLVWWRIQDNESYVIIQLSVRFWGKHVKPKWVTNFFCAVHPTPQFFHTELLYSVNNVHTWTNTDDTYSPREYLELSELTINQEDWHRGWNR